MKTIDDIYTPYDFTKNRCYVFVLTIEKKGFLKIEHKLPSFIQQLKGIFVSSNCVTGIGQIAGLISMNFNGQAFKSFQFPVYKTNHLEDCSHPNEFNDTLLPNSFIQGFYYDLTETKVFPYEVHVYVHYENKEYKPL